MSDAEAARQEAARAGRGFGGAASAYVAGRPGYPPELVAWLLGDARDVVDVGAGTGKLTAALIGDGRRVTAVEPDDGMRAALRREVPSATAVGGTAESLPLQDASADALVFGQAWHWVDVDAASAEAARVLRPGGTLGLIWNIRDSSVPWIAELGRIMRGSPAEHAIETDGVRVAAPFGPLERRTLAWDRPATVDEVVALAASRSYVIALPVEEQRDVERRIRQLLAERPETAGRDRIAIPYRTTAFRVRRP